MSGTSQSNNDSYRVNKREISYILVPGQRLNSELLYSIDEKNLYRRNARKKQGSYYLCKEVNCGIRILCNANGKCFRTDETRQHLHADHEEEYKRNVIQNEIKVRCIKGEKSTINVREIFNEAISK